MVNVAIPILGGSYKHRSSPLNSQVTINWYPELNADAKSNLALLPTPGTKAFSSGQSGEIDRGMHCFKSILYKVSGGGLYKISSNGTQLYIGDIMGSERCAFINDGSSMIIVTSGFVYSFDGSLLQIENDLDFERPNTVAYLNNQAIFDGDNGRWVVSDAGQLANINSLNYATAESNGDNLVRVYVFDQVLYLFGEHTIEPWYNSGSGSPPFDRIEGGLLEIGLIARWSVANNDNFIYFLGDDRLIYRLNGADATRITNPALSHTFFEYEVVNDAIGMCFTWNGQNMYSITFPSVDKTWCYSESTNTFFQISSNLYGGRHLANSYLYCYSKHLIADYTSGDVYEWDFDSYTEVNNEPIKRVRHSRVIDGALLNASLIGRPVFMGQMEVLLNSGSTNLLTGQGSDPLLMLRFSDDGAKTWSNYIHGSIGKIAERNYRVIFSPLGSFYQRVIELSCTDPVGYEIYSARAELEVGV